MQTYKDIPQLFNNALYVIEKVYKMRDFKHDQDTFLVFRKRKDHLSSQIKIMNHILRSLSGLGQLSPV